MYYPDFNVPFAYAYKWIRAISPDRHGALAGRTTYGIALKGDTLLYVTDNLNGDRERIYAYDLTNGTDIGWVERRIRRSTTIGGRRAWITTGVPLPRGQPAGRKCVRLPDRLHLRVRCGHGRLGTRFEQDLNAYPVPAEDVLFIESGASELLPAQLIDASVARSVSSPG